MLVDSAEETIVVSSPRMESGKNFGSTYVVSDRNDSIIEICVGTRQPYSKKSALNFDKTEFRLAVTQSTSASVPSHSSFVQKAANETCFCYF